MGEFIARAWDLSKPLWEMIIVENYHDEDGAECALIVRGYVSQHTMRFCCFLQYFYMSRHHTLADGQGEHIVTYFSRTGSNRNRATDFQVS